MALNIEIIAIGNEVLTGSTVNTNAAFIGQELLKIGLRVNSQRTLSDDPELLQQGLSESFAKFDLIICTGGLGPTCDDVTRHTIAQVFNCELKFIPEIAEHLKPRYSNRPVSIQDQATIPSKAEYILNEIGTASALVFNENNKLMIFLPGIPTELQHFMRTQIIPLLKQKYHSQFNELHQQCNFFQITESQVDPILRQLKIEYPAADFGIYPNLGIISVHIISHFDAVAENIAYQKPIKDKLIATFKDNFFSDQTDNIAVEISNMCRTKNLTVGLLQTSPDLILTSRLGSCLLNSEFRQSSQNIKDLAQELLQDSKCNLAVVITGMPNMSLDEEIYSTELNIALQMRDQEVIIKTMPLRGNKAMLARRAEHTVFAELFRFLRYTI